MYICVCVCMCVRCARLSFRYDSVCPFCPPGDNETLRCRPTRWPARLLPKCCDNAFLRSASISYGTLIKLYVFGDLRAYYIHDIVRVFNYQMRLLVFFFPSRSLHKRIHVLNTEFWADPTFYGVRTSGKL